MKRPSIAMLGLAVVAGTFALIGAGDGSGPDMVVPQYDDDGNLIRPKDYRDWIFVGASIGLSYFEPTANAKPKDEDDPGLFHHVYIQPQAYDHYAFRLRAA